MFCHNIPYKAKLYFPWIMRLLLILMLITLVAGRPGLLRVPKVYNAVITSNQNLSPSRAFPVIQPVIHRTAIGYVPPFYYTQVAPHYAGPDVVHLPQSTTKSFSSVMGTDHEKSSSSSDAETSRSNETGDQKEETAERNSPENHMKSLKNGAKKKNEEEAPLSFYPNYQSLYYDPYFYTYNGFNPHFVPGTYYVDYQPFGALEPIPPSTPKNGQFGQLLPGYHEEMKNQEQGKNEKEKVPDVPPPPVPTAAPKSS